MIINVTKSYVLKNIYTSSGRLSFQDQIIDNGLQKCDCNVKIYIECIVFAIINGKNIIEKTLMSKPLKWKFIFHFGTTV